MQKIVLIIILTFNLSSVFSQTSTEQAKITYLYYFGHYVKWPYKSNTGTFHIGIYKGKEIEKNLLTDMSKKQKINDSEIKVSFFDSSINYDSLNILYTPLVNLIELKQIVNNCMNNNVLLVTDEENVNYTMINFKYSDNRQIYEINEENIWLANLEVYPKLVVLSKDQKQMVNFLTKVDSMLTNAKSELALMEEQIKQQQEEINKKNGLIIKINGEIAKKRNEVDEQKSKLDKLLINIDKHRNRLNNKIKELEKQEITINYQKKDINKQKDELLSQKQILDKQKEKIGEYNLKIKEQRKTLENQTVEIQTQKLIITFVLVVAVLIFILVIISYRAYIAKKKVTNILAEKNTVISEKAESLLVANNRITEALNELSEKNAKLDKAYNNIKILSEIGKQITSSIMVESLVKIVYENINALMDANIFSIGFLNKDEYCLDFPISIEKGKNLPSFKVSLIEKDRPAVKSFVKKETIILNSIDDYKKLTSKGAIVGEIPESVIYHPLIVKGRALGVITIQSFHKNAYSKQSIDLFKNIAVYTSIAIDNANVFIKIEKQKSEIEEQRDIATQQKIQITDSIHYAKRIQSAVLPTVEYVNSIVPDNFLLYKPRDIVSGDFYWVTKIDNYRLIAVADCTGHGVPGAFMSMLGISYLDEIVKSQNTLKVDLILERLREHIKNALKQNGRRNEAKDGMEMGLCIIDDNKNTMHFAGANMSMIMIRNNQINEIAPVYNPICIFYNESCFEERVIELQHKDIFYLYSDGYKDQFGGEEGLKFMSTNFKKLLLRINNENFNAQKEILSQTLDDWMENPKTGIKYSQIDDILVFGFRP